MVIFIILTMKSFYDSNCFIIFRLCKEHVKKAKGRGSKIVSKLQKSGGEIWFVMHYNLVFACVNPQDDFMFLLSIMINGSLFYFKTFLFIWLSGHTSLPRQRKRSWNCFSSVVWSPQKTLQFYKVHFLYISVFHAIIFLF